MDIKQTSNHLQRLGQPFDVLIGKDGVERVLYSNLEPTDVEGLLNEVLATHNPDTLVIQERKRNGSTNLKQNKYNISLGAIDAPSTSTIMPNQPIVNSIPSDFKDYMISDLKEKNSKLEKRLEKLENENEKLKKENFELEKENKYKDKEFELDKKATEYEKSNGLSGIMETVSTNPALASIAATAIGRLMGIDVPQMGALDPHETQPGQDDQSTQTKVAGYIRNWLLKQEEAVATQFFELTNLMAQDPSLLTEVLEMIKVDSHETA